MQAVRRDIWWIVALLLVGGWYFFFFRVVPCQKPIEYKIGAFDTRFGISKADFIRNISTAESVWEKPLNKNLFEYNPNAKISINLIYDDRQKKTQQNALLRTDANKTNNLAQAVKQQYVNLEADYEARKAEYVALLNIFQTNQTAYINQVAYWNSRGGAPKKEYDALNVQKQKLETEHVTLENKRLQMNALVDQINSFITKYNLLVRDANSTINTINQSAGEEFQEGEYDPNTDAINIYEFSTNKKLTRVLAHELGHAIGLDHNNNAESIMYPLNSGESEVASPDDISALKVVCGVK